MTVLELLDLVEKALMTEQTETTWKALHYLREAIAQLEGEAVDK